MPFKVLLETPEYGLPLNIFLNGGMIFHVVKAQTTTICDDWS